jgi:hypothetical protein
MVNKRYRSNAALLVQFVYHANANKAALLAEYLHGALNDDPSVPGLRIPTLFMPQIEQDHVPEPQLATEADRVLVVVLADDNLAANARGPTRSERTWADYIVELRCLCKETDNQFMPIQLTEHAWPIDTRLEDLDFLRAWAFDDEQIQQCFIARHIIHLALRRLQSRPLTGDAPPLTIFLSYTKLDIETEPRVVRSLLAHLTANQPQKTWFDSGDIEVGSRFAKEIEGGIEDAALLAVLTDSYSSRSWCRREVLLAKHYKRPVVVVDALQKREVRSFPYAGNVPVVRWKGDAQEVIDALLREALRQSYATESLEKRKRAGDIILPTVPELLTLVHCDSEHDVLYPDPPLGSEELAVIEKTGVRVETPLERHVREHDLTAKSLVVALSTSPAEDISCLGLRLTHLESALLEISRYLLISGIRLAYGGHLGIEGYTTRLANLLSDPVIKHLRSCNIMPSVKDGPKIINYLPWPSFETVHSRARMGPLVDIIMCQRPDGIDEKLDPLFTDPIQCQVPVDSLIRRFAWARGLTDMRRRQVAEVKARVVVGGCIGSAANGYSGRMPGVLEEILLSIEANQPVYLIGAYGGCARLVCEALNGHCLPGLTWDHHQAISFLTELRNIYIDKSMPWEEYDVIFQRLRDGGFNILHNGLRPEENQELAVTRSTERTIELILTGLQNLYSDKEEI